jgi:hypothetical protein
MFGLNGGRGAGVGVGSVAEFMLGRDCGASIAEEYQVVC